MNQTIFFIPAREQDVLRDKKAIKVNGKTLLRHTLEAVEQSALPGQIIVSTDSELVAELALREGIKIPFLRDPSLADDNTSLGEVMKWTQNSLRERAGINAPYWMLLELSHPIRPPGLLKKVFETMVTQDLDSVFPALEIGHKCWTVQEDGGLLEISPDQNSNRQKRQKIFAQLHGLACATRESWISQGRIVGDNIGIVPVRGLFGYADLKEPVGRQLAELICEHPALLEQVIE